MIIFTEKYLNVSILVLIMVRSKKEQEAFETQLWKEEAGELICIQKGLKHIRKNG